MALQTPILAKRRFECCSHKKAILFFRCEIEKSISLLITGNTHPNCTLVPYENENGVENFVRDGLSSGYWHLEATAGSA
jgi:hypothetical protein